ncbi:isoaspartyl peptidase/L-asparaginase-like isoform X3 [Pseudoliparis swirei]|uniref:isoaspartyl peptidase/L-asparaginase-like isoform X3 n=1 Tax=Pseudoliparis swirei TaxID=2059687 RepID=UPI0024BE4AB4|nr:isoaspartyl peptidase/L-asparaginase-like isoform X3 [Pseudoliparis swirei]
MFPVVVVHGGSAQVPKERDEKVKSGGCSAARAGYAVLRAGGSSMDAVVEAVSQLENNPYFNAGRGSALNIRGEVEMDAIIMDGKTLGSGAVSAVRNIANPIQLARLVMDKTSHVCLTAKGANQFARSMGVPEVPPESLVTEYSRMRWTKNRAPGTDTGKSQMGKMGTVGAVAVDSEGNMACATSTGSGGYADNQVGAVSSTGHGEAIMKVTLARLILFHMEQGQSVEAASDLGLAYMESRVGGLGGVVTVDPQGHWAARFSCPQMFWAAAQKDTLHYGLQTGEDFTQSIDDPL